MVLRVGASLQRRQSPRSCRICSSVSGPERGAGTASNRLKDGAGGRTTCPKSGVRGPDSAAIGTRIGAGGVARRAGAGGCFGNGGAADCPLAAPRSVAEAAGAVLGPVRGRA